MPSRQCTPGREFVTRPASAAGASSTTPQTTPHMCSIFLLTLRSHASPILKHSILSPQDLVISGSVLAGSMSSALQFQCVTATT
ncbi:hypothetical protein B0H14DRAFT_3525912 [Mycena olivaceomarginata]|nr:hypothetical protein B0H14DRAFT_3525912 [Mycena olivaceomarginata]